MKNITFQDINFKIFEKTACNMNFTYKHMESTPFELGQVLKPSQELEKLIPENDTLLSVVAFSGKRPIGLVVGYEKNEKELYIANIHVIGMDQGKGVGTNLLTMLEELAKEKGFVKLSLCVFDGNTRATRLYTKRAFEKKGYFGKSFASWTKNLN